MSLFDPGLSLLIKKENYEQNWRQTDKLVGIKGRDLLNLDSIYLDKIVFGQ